MYPSGQWDGFWEQPGLGRQPMTAFVLTFQGAAVTGGGKDIVGRFLVQGNVDQANGRIHMVKQYIGKHKVLYDGEPDGEGSIVGTWRIADDYTGPFMLRPVLRLGHDDEP